MPVDRDFRPAMPRFSHLTEQALAFLESDGGWQPSTALAAAVLGPSFARQPFFVHLVEQQLAADSRFSRSAAGQWGIASWTQLDPPLEEHEFVVVDVETTGGQTGRHRIVEVAAIRIRGGQPDDAYQSLVNPLKPLPHFVTDFTGITQEMLDGAPFSSQVLQELRAFIGDRTLVGHNVACDLAFLNYESLWHGLPPFGNLALDTEELARKLLPWLKRPSLDRVASALGINPPLRHRALADARATVAILVALLERVDPEQVRTFGDLQRWLASHLAARHERRRRVRTLLPAGVLRALPERPGIYLFKDGAGQTLYVGKAVNLRDRVIAHFTSTASYARQLDALLERTAAVEHHIRGSELAALLAESQAIRELQPPYNVQTRSRRGCPFLRLDASLFPRPSAASAVAADVYEGARYYGPYRTTRAVRQTIATLYRVFQLRACRRKLPAARKKLRIPCLRLVQQLCPGPCAPLVTSAQYSVLVHYAMLYLTNGKEAALQALERRLTEAGAGGWEAAILRACLIRLRRVRREHRPVEGGLAGHSLVLVYPATEADQAELFFLRDGELAARETISLAACPAPQELAECIRRHLAGSTPHPKGHASSPVAEHQPGNHGCTLSTPDLPSTVGSPLSSVLRPPPAAPACSGSAAPSGDAPDLDHTNLLLRWIYRHQGAPELIPVADVCQADEAALAVAVRLEALATIARSSDAAPQHALGGEGGQRQQAEQGD